MERFVFGSKDQFNCLDELCHDYCPHYWPDVTLPSCYEGTHVSLCFRLFPDNSYVLTINPSACITQKYISQSMDKLLSEHRLVFRSKNEMMNFFWSLQPLFSLNVAEPINLPVGQYENNTESKEEITDWIRLNQLLEINKKKKNISAKDISDKLKEKIFGQDEAIDALADKISLSLMREPRKVCIIFEAGPTGVGKSEIARLLPQILTELSGDEFGFINVAGNEFESEFSIQRFFGAPPGYVGYSQPTIFEPIRNNQNHILVIDEIEKATPAVLKGLMEAFDTGKVNMADNSAPIDLSKTIIIMTSNILVDDNKLKVFSSFEQDEYFRDILTKHWGLPEISARIQKFIYFNPLSDEAKVKVIFKFISEELRSYKLELIHIDEELVVELLASQSRYGARALRTRIQESIGRSLIQEGWLGEAEAKVSITGTSLNSIHFEFSK